MVSFEFRLALAFFAGGTSRAVPRAVIRRALGRVLGSPGFCIAYVELLQGWQTLLQGLEGRRRQLGAIQIQFS